MPPSWALGFENRQSGIRRASVSLTAAEMAALTSNSGKVLVRGVAGRIYLPLLWLVSKRAGAAFTLGSATSIMVGHAGLGNYIGINSAGLLDQTAKTAKYRHGAVMGASGDACAQYDGKDLIVLVNAGSLSGGIDVDAKVVYFDVQLP